MWPLPRRYAVVPLLAGLTAGPHLAETPATYAAPAAAPAASTRLADPTRGHYRVRVVDYDLGATAYTVPGFHSTDADGEPTGRLAPIELTATVHYPVDHSARRHPLVVISHGLWETCADRRAGRAWTAALAGLDTLDYTSPGAAAEEARLDAILDRTGPLLNRWPCRPGTPPLPSYRGYDYLGRSLARAGIVAVSISANGINVGEQGEAADRTRASLINAHLRLWARLDRTGGGPLAGHFTHHLSRRPAHPDFTQRIDLDRVGTVGHSRGGRGVMWQAAGSHQGAWPRGVRVRAAVALAPAGAGQYDPGTVGASQYLPTHVPFLVWLGTCDAATSTGGQDYLRFALGRTREPLTQLTVHGADHDFLNQQWSPSSGQVRANDDLDTPGVPRAVPGHCTETLPDPLVAGDPSPPTPAPNAQRELTEGQERRVAAYYTTAYLRRWLLGDHRWDAVLDGRVSPLAGVARVEAEEVG